MSCEYYPFFSKQMLIPAKNDFLLSAQGCDNPNIGKLYFYGKISLITLSFNNDTHVPEEKIT